MPAGLGWSVLYASVYAGVSLSLEILRMLFERGADPNVKSGPLPLKRAIDNSWRFGRMGEAIKDIRRVWPPFIRKLDGLLITTFAMRFAPSSTPDVLVPFCSNQFWRGSRSLRDDVVNHMSMHIGQPKVSPGDLVGQLQVIQPEEMQQRGVEVVQVDLIFDGKVAVLVRGSIADAGFHAAAS